MRRRRRKPRMLPVHPEGTGGDNLGKGTGTGQDPLEHFGLSSVTQQGQGGDLPQNIDGFILLTEGKSAGRKFPAEVTTNRSPVSDFSASSMRNRKIQALETPCAICAMVTQSWGYSHQNCTC